MGGLGGVGALLGSAWLGSTGFGGCFVVGLVVWLLAWFGGLR